MAHWVLILRNTLWELFQKVCYDILSVLPCVLSHSLFSFPSPCLACVCYGNWELLAFFKLCQVYSYCWNVITFILASLLTQMSMTLSVLDCFVALYTQTYPPNTYSAHNTNSQSFTCTLAYNMYTYMYTLTYTQHKLCIWICVCVMCVFWLCWRADEPRSLYSLWSGNTAWESVNHFSFKSMQTTLVNIWTILGSGQSCKKMKGSWLCREEATQIGASSGTDVSRIWPGTTELAPHHGQICYWGS